LGCIKNLYYVCTWYAEPKGGSQDDFELALKGYYDSIHHNKRPASGRKRRIKKTDLNHFHAVDSLQVSNKGGAALLGVCRGKVHHNFSHPLFYYFRLCLKILYLQFDFCHTLENLKCIVYTCGK
jgi:Fanconi anemia group J protein